MIVKVNEEKETAAIFCPACEKVHEFPLEYWNGSQESVTLNRDVHIPNGKFHGCHFKITNNRIEYCKDSTHTLASQSTTIVKYQDGNFVDPQFEENGHND